MCARIVKSRRIFSSPLFQQSCVLTGKWVEWNGGLSGMEENKKSGGGDVRAEALS